MAIRGGRSYNSRQLVTQPLFVLQIAQFFEDRLHGPFEITDLGRSII
jgi:hypothetical protein